MSCGESMGSGTAPRAVESPVPSVELLGHVNRKMVVVDIVGAADLGQARCWLVEEERRNEKELAGEAVGTRANKAGSC